MASGLAHLHSRGLLHRDVAARNVLVCRGRGRAAALRLTTILPHPRSPPLCERERPCRMTPTPPPPRPAPDGRPLYYGGEGALPFLWLPPEALSRRRFSAASDVCSLGVLAWEVRGGCPIGARCDRGRARHLHETARPPVAGPRRC